MLENNAGMFNLKVEMFGLPSNATTLRDVNVELNDGASIPDLISALKKAIPALEGPVILEGAHRLTENYTFNINGHFYIGYEHLKLKPVDSVKLLLVASGG
jgi:hypothetical protein